MDGLLIVILVLSLLFNAALVYFCIAFQKDICRLKGRVDAVRGSAIRRRLRLGHGKKTSAEISTALSGLMDAFGRILETRQSPEVSQKQRISGVHRDIGAPLAALTDQLDILREQTPAGDERGEYLEILYRKARLLHRMIGEYVELLSLEAEDAALPLSPLDACENIRDLLAAFYQDFVAASVTPEVTLPDVPVMVTGNRAALERVLSNLLFNALKHSGGGKIAVSLREDDTTARIAVADTGKGIAEADLPYVFDRLFTPDKARAAMERGTGLGLEIAKRLTEMQGGAIEVQSRPGAQTVFTVVLPKA